MTLTPKRCACETLKVLVRGFELCPHCERVCGIERCQTCRKYQTAIALKKADS